MTELNDGPARKHLLLTVLGKDPKPAQYTLEDRCVEARLAPIALFNLLPEEKRPDRVLALCTPEAKQDSWPLLEQELDDRCQVAAVEVPAGDTQEDVNAFLATVTGAIPEKAELTVDVTHGYRHFSFLTYIAVLYLAALRGAAIRGAYYGMLNRDAPSPFLDLRPLLELPRWVFALEVIRETGSGLPLAKALRGRSDSPSALKVARDLSRFSEAYLSGLPIELGRQARNVREQCLKPLKKMLRQEHRLPLADELVDRLDKMLEPFVLTNSDSGDGWKRRLVLSRVELERQARVIDDLLKHEKTATALGLMNEWTVSWVVWLGSESKWLDFNPVRRSAASLLSAMAAVGQDPALADTLTENQRSLGDFWRRLSEVRNAYHHHGMRGQLLVGNKNLDENLNDLQVFWKSVLRSCPKMSLSLGESPGGAVLVSPIGLRPGVLFSAVQACRANEDSRDPALCLVICSPETEELIAEALKHAEFGGEFVPLVLEDAFGGGPDEIRELVSTARRRFIGTDEVLVNVTGGTTLMGLAAESLASEARLLACPSVRRFGLIDRRPPSEQENDPYQAGDPFWFDDGEEENAYPD